ncbi:hypothetical protein [Spirulina sp. 06S082]|nr:hypothetical protein [Spirulina sp. 06S082]MEA5468115.1 hypothetical protein [Spirulina sp. 06S082]
MEIFLILAYFDDIHKIFDRQQIANVLDSGDLKRAIAQKQEGELLDE